jgi:hypothetical protein
MPIHLKLDFTPGIENDNLGVELKPSTEESFQVFYLQLS